MSLITSLHLKPQDYRVATFITCIGPEAIEIHGGLPFASEAEKGRIDKVLELWDQPSPRMFSAEA